MLTSLQNPLVKQIRKLHRSKERRQQQLFLLEGTHLIEAASGVDRPFETLCHTLEWQAQHPHLWQQAAQQAARVEVVSLEVLRSLCTTVEPDGVVATMRDRLLPLPGSPAWGWCWRRYKIPATWAQSSALRPQLARKVCC